MKTIVVYDTKHGATEEVAVRIAGAIRETGEEAELLDLRERGAEKTSLEDFAAVVLGGPFYMGSWSRRAAAFAARREAELKGKSFAVFALGSDEDLGEAEAEAAVKAALPPSLAAKARWAHFGGRIDFARLGGFERFIMKTVGGKTESTSTLDLTAAAAFGAGLAKGDGK
jgi:menaquinone-dependent protoporphyrinogen oxidase